MPDPEPGLTHTRSTSALACTLPMAPTIEHGAWEQATLAPAPAGCALRGSGAVGRRCTRPPGRAPRLRRAAAAAGRGAARAVPPARHGRRPPGDAHDPAR